MSVSLNLQPLGPDNVATRAPSLCGWSIRLTSCDLTNFLMRFACATTRGFLAKKMICRIDNWHFLTLYTMRSFFLIQGPTCPSQFGVKYWYLSKITQSFSLNDFAGECKHSFRQLYFLSIGGVVNQIVEIYPYSLFTEFRMSSWDEGGAKYVDFDWFSWSISANQQSEKSSADFIHRRALL